MENTKQILLDDYIFSIIDIVSPKLDPGKGNKGIKLGWYKVKFIDKYFPNRKTNIRLHEVHLGNEYLKYQEKGFIPYILRTSLYEIKKDLLYCVNVKKILYHNDYSDEPKLFNRIRLPNTLEEIEFLDHECSIIITEPKLSNYIFPNSLKKIKLNYYFNSNIENLPDSVENIIVQHHFNSNIKAPKKLKEITITNDNYDISKIDFSKCENKVKINRIELLTDYEFEIAY